MKQIIDALRIGARRGVEPRKYVRKISHFTNWGSVDSEALETVDKSFSEQQEAKRRANPPMGAEALVYRDLSRPMREAQRGEILSMEKVSLDPDALTTRFDSITTHPTEIMPLMKLKIGDALGVLEEIQIVAIAKHWVSGADRAKLAMIIEEFGLDTEICFSSTISSMEFRLIIDEVKDRLKGLSKTYDLILGEQRTSQDERDLLLYNADKFRLNAAKICVASEGVKSMDEVQATSWADDRDAKAKPAIDGLNFVVENQKYFYNKVSKMLYWNIKAMETDGERAEEIAKVRKIYDAAIAINHVLHGNPDQVKVLSQDQGEQQVKKLLNLFEQVDFAKLKSHTVTDLNILRSYIDKSCGRVMSNVSSTRQEILVTANSNNNLVDIIYQNSEEFRDKLQELGIRVRNKNFKFVNLSEDDRVKLLEFLYHPENLEPYATSLVDNMDLISEETRNELLWYMASSIANSKGHEHISSHFNATVSGFLHPYILENFARSLHARTNMLEDYLALESEKSGVRFIVDGEFNPVLKHSPLNEDALSILSAGPSVANIMKNSLCREIITGRQEGVFLKTDSNSDGSSALGSYGALFYNLLSNIKIRKTLAEEEVKLDVLFGVGWPDLDRVGGASSGDRSERRTIQGSDARSITVPTLVEELLQDPLFNEKQLAALLENPNFEAEIKAFIDATITANKMSETGIVDARSKRASGHMVHRGIIQGSVADILNRASARKATRSASGSKDSWSSDPSKFHSVVDQPNMRRIGAVNLQRTDMMHSFLMAPFFNKIAMTEGVKEMHHLSIFRNQAMSALTALSCSSSEAFLACNDIEVSEVELRDLSNQFQILYATDHNSLSSISEQKLRMMHACYVLDKRSNVLGNAVAPFMDDLTPDTREQITELLADISPLQDDFSSQIQEVASLIAHDAKAPEDLKNHFSKLQHMTYDIQMHRALLKDKILTATCALQEDQEEVFNQTVEGIAPLIRMTHPLQAVWKVDSVLNPHTSRNTASSMIVGKRSMHTDAREQKLPFSWVRSLSSESKGVDGLVR